MRILSRGTKKQLRYILLSSQAVLLTFLAYPLLLVITATFAVYRCIIDIILRLKIGERYGGLLSTTDSFFLKEDTSKIYVTSVIILKSNRERDIYYEYLQLLQRKVFDIPRLYPKFTSTVHIFGGYPYLLKDGCSLNECARPLLVPENEIFDEQYMKDLVSSLAHQPLPQNNTALWEYLFSQKPFQRNDGYYYYPLIARFNHAVGDGTSLMHFLLNYLPDEETENYSEKLSSDKLVKPQHRQEPFFHYLSSYLSKKVKALKETTYILFMGIGRSMQINQVQPEDANSLHGPALTGEKFVAWSVEDSVKFVPIVKNIKNQLGTKFSHVIMTAISASLSSFFKRNSDPVPESMRALVPLLVNFPTLDPSKALPLANRSVAASLKVPLHSTNSLIETLRKVLKAGDLNVADVKVNKIILNCIGLLPQNIVKTAAGFKAQTCLISNVPGGSQAKFFGDCVIEKIVPLAPNWDRIGVTITILTYDDKFQLGLVIDKSLIQSQKEAQQIVDDIFHYINELDEEVKKPKENYL